MHINTSKLGNAIAKSIPHIFTAAGVLWYGIAVYTAFTSGARAAKADKTLDDTTKEEIVKDILPAVGSFAIGTACVILADAYNTRMLRASNAAYVRLSNNFQEYKAAVVGALGAEANKTALKAAADQNRPDISDELEPGYYHFYEPFSRNDFVAKLEDVVSAEYMANRMLADRGFVTINEFYDELGLAHIDRGNEIGWDVGELGEYFGICWLDFENVEHVEEDGSKWYSIHAIYDPTVDGAIDPDVDWYSIKDMIAKSGQRVVPEAF